MLEINYTDWRISPPPPPSIPIWRIFTPTSNPQPHPTSPTPHPHPHPPHPTPVRGCALWVTHSPTFGKTLHTPSDIYAENVHLDWFNRDLCTGEHFQSDLDIFRFDFMCVKPPDVPPLSCFNVQTDMRFWFTTAPFYSAYPRDTAAVVIKISC